MNRTFTDSTKIFPLEFPIGKVTYEIMLSVEGTTGEIGLRWHELNMNLTAPRLEAFDDSWAALAKCHDLIDALAQLNDKNVTPDQVKALLVDLGFIEE